MSWSWALVRGSSVNPSSLKFSALMNKQNIAENELFKPESNTPKSISVRTEDLVLLQDPLNFQKLVSANTHFRGPFEPDGQHLRLWLRFNHLGRTIKDYSGFCNDFTTSVVLPHGQPILCKGPDDGVKGGQIVTRFNYDIDNHIDSIKVLNPEESNIGAIDTVNGFTISVKFRLDEDTITQLGGQDPRIWYHVDDPNGDYGECIKIGSDKSLKWIVRDAGVSRSFVSPANVIQSRVWHRATLKYNPTGNVLQMKIDNKVQSDTGDDSPSFPSGQENSVFLAAGLDGDSGPFVGRLADVRWYDFITMDDHDTNLWNNGRSICASYATTYGGGDDLLNMGNQSSLWSQSKTKWTVSYWVRFNDDADCTIGGSTGWGSVNGSVLFWRFAGTVGCGIWNAGVETDAWDDATDLTGNRKWIHTFNTYDSTLGSANIKFYIDGKLGDTTNNATTTNNPNDTMRLGWTSGAINGEVRHFRYWVNQALTAQNAIDDRDGRYGLLPTPNYWLKLTEGNDVPRDFIGKSLTATFTNGSAWKLSSSHKPTPFGSLAVAGHSFFNPNYYGIGYDSTAYDSTGYDTT